MSDDNRNDGLDLDKFFKTYPPIGDKPTRFDEIRNAARFFAEMVLRLAPKCADRTAAIRKIREAVWTANYAIASDEDDSRYMKTVGYDPKTQLVPVSETLKRESYDMLASWIEENATGMIGTSDNEMGETAVAFAIRIISSMKEKVSWTGAEKQEK